MTDKFKDLYGFFIYHNDYDLIRQCVIEEISKIDFNKKEDTVFLFETSYGWLDGFDVLKGLLLGINTDDEIRKIIKADRKYIVYSIYNEDKGKVYISFENLTYEEYDKFIETFY